MRRKGFTLIELLVVIAIIALLASILMPTLKKAQELANRAKCIGHLKNLAPGLKMYSDIYQSMPWVNSTNTAASWSGTATGANAGRPGAPTAPSASTAQAITSLPWLLVRTNNGTPEMFVCPSDKQVKVETAARDTSTPPNYYWDFSIKDPADNKFTTSYSWQAPIVDSSNKVVNGVNDDDASVAIMSDKTPSNLYAGSQAGLTGWTSSISAANIPKYNSPNHSGGEVTQFLTSSYSGGRSSRPDCGQNNDFIFGASNDVNGGAQYGVTEDISSHKSTADSYLIGPK